MVGLTALIFESHWRSMVPAQYVFKKGWRGESAEQIEKRDAKYTYLCGNLTLEQCILQVVI